MSRPLVSVFSGSSGSSVASVPLQAVFLAPIRLDIVQEVHRDLAKNKRQPYAVSPYAGHQTSAESWGTGRAVARIPRVPGGGTHRSGQGAFGNMCRKGRMFAPTKTYRRWHRKVNKNQRRYAVVSALAATASTSLVIARGHNVHKVAELPLVISNKGLNKIEKTSVALRFLKKIGILPDVERVKTSKKLRCGKGKMRNRRYVHRRGPLVIYDSKTPLIRAMRNLPGIDTLCVTRMNLLKLAPGGHIGRLCVWVQSAFLQLDKLYGTFTQKSKFKAHYHLPQPMMKITDLSRIVNSDEIQSVLRRKKRQARSCRIKFNPLTNNRALFKLNPYAAFHKKYAKATQVARTNRRKQLAKARAKKEPVKRLPNEINMSKHFKKIAKMVKATKRPKRFIKKDKKTRDEKKAALKKKQEEKLAKKKSKTEKSAKAKAKANAKAKAKANRSQTIVTTIMVPAGSE